MSEKVDEVLIDRAQHYDTSAGQAWELAGQVLGYMAYLGLLKRVLETSYSFAWIIILVKLVRIAQDPKHLDSWLDIGGYAKLAYDKLSKETPE